MKGKYLFLFIIRLQMLPFCSYIARGLPFTEEYQSTRCTVWRKIIRTAAFFTTVNDMLLWMTLTVWKNQSRRKAFRCCDSQTTNSKTAIIQDSDIWYFSFNKLRWSKLDNSAYKKKQWVDQTQKYGHFSPLCSAILQHDMLR